ncbi:MAG: acetylornithine deacetylase [Hyphomicrobiaceae bacterium]|nr:acetylornithine deacetylase [Hyphomicrobiaceae bacterium]
MQGPTYSPKELLARLVSFDTTSHLSNMGIVRFIEDYLAQHGVASQLVPTPDGAKASLYATIGPKTAGGVALSGHTDVVPVNVADWTVPPFVLTERDGRLYGRGAADMKGFLACVLAAVPAFAQRRLARPVHIAFSYDEEIGCVGVRPMIGELGRSLPKPDLVVVGEPTSMAVVDAHKGPIRWQVKVNGLAAHSSMSPLGVNAIHFAARLIGELQRIEAALMRAPRDDRFLPPHATLQVTEIRGGTAANIVPVACGFGFEIRALPGLDVAGIEQRIRTFIETECLPDMQRIAPHAGIDLVQTNSVPPFAASPGSAAVALALRLAEQNETHAVSYATEAGLFQDAGVHSVVCGPGDIAQAHTADEWIAVSELDRCMAFLTRLGDWAEA